MIFPTEGYSNYFDIVSLNLKKKKQNIFCSHFHLITFRYHTQIFIFLSIFSHSPFAERIPICRCYIIKFIWVHQASHCAHDFSTSTMRLVFLFPFLIVIAWDRSNRPNRMYPCCHKRMNIALDPDHIFWYTQPTEVLRICVKWFAHRFRLRVATRKALPATKPTKWWKIMLIYSEKKIIILYAPDIRGLDSRSSLPDDNTISLWRRDYYWPFPTAIQCDQCMDDQVNRLTRKRHCRRPVHSIYI